MARKYLLLGMLLLLGRSFAATTAQPIPSYKTSENSSEINYFKGTYDDFLREAKKQKKTILIDFWATWCAPCKKMEMETFSDETLIRYLNEKYLVYKVDVDTFDGMAIADRFVVDTFPSLVVLDSKGKFINKLNGFFPANYLLNELQKNKNVEGKRFVAQKMKSVAQ